MDQNDHGISLAGLDLPGREKPSLNVEPFVSPLKILAFPPRRRLSGIVAGQLAPFIDRSGPDIRWRFIAAAGCRCEFAILGDGKVREVAKGGRPLCLSDCPHELSVISSGNTSASDCSAKDGPARQKSELTSLCDPRVRSYLVAIGWDGKQVATRNPSSLIKPVKAIDLPSGDQREPPPREKACR